MVLLLRFCGSVRRTDSVLIADEGSPTVARLPNSIRHRSRFSFGQTQYLSPKAIGERCHTGVDNAMHSLDDQRRAREATDFEVRANDHV